MPEYDLSSGTAFDHTIRLHNANVQNIVDTRAVMAGHAEELRNFLFDDYPLTRAQASYTNHQRRSVRYWQGMRANPTDPVEQVFARTLTAYESRTCFDPWNGRWKGKWNSATQSWGQRHIWDVTQPYSGVIGGAAVAQHIQPVTQRTTQPNLAEFVEGPELTQAWAGGTVNLAINVYDDARGVTGWVSRREGGTHYEVPHIGLLLNPHTLIWIAQFRPTNNVQMSLAEDFLMFFEWVLPAQNIYGIHGQRFRIDNGRIVPVRVEGWSEYAKVVGATPPARQQAPQSVPQEATPAPQRRQRLRVP